MEEVKLSLKIQNGDKCKRLSEKQYSSLAELKEFIENSFKNMTPNSYVLKYQDSEGDWLYIFDDSDLLALKEYYRENGSKLIKLFIESQQDLAQSTFEPKRFNQSTIKDSCVAEVEAFLATQNENKEEVKEEIKEVSLVNEDSDMDIEIIEKVGQSEPDHEKQVEELNHQISNTHIEETQPETSNEQMNIEPVIIEEEKHSEIPQDVEIEEEELIDTSNNKEEQPQQEQEELKEFNIMELLQNIQNTVNKDQNEFKPKDLIHTVKDTVKGTKAEKNLKKVCNQWKKKKGFFFKKIMQGFFNGNFCQQQEDKYANVVHNGITCDGCHKGPITGVRYKCSECPDFDLCSECEGKDMHNHHVFLKLKYPMGVDIIYSHRTDENVPQTPFQVPAPQPAAPQHHPHHPPHGGWGPHMRGPWGRGGRGGRGGRCHRNWENNNPLMQLAQQFLGGMNNDNSESSGSPQRRERPQGGWGSKRPVITKKPVDPIIGTAGGLQIVETAVQNQSPWPYNLKKVQLEEADEGILFEEISTEVNLKKNESQEFCLAVQLPEKPGTYKAKFAFINHRGVSHGEKLDVVFQVLPDATQ